ncbi:tyrosyl-tRNA synthetase [Allomyces arbusculus]|nr:tyrosyl-tRNA synthetase [Allomyces arbusculus]
MAQINLARTMPALVHDLVGRGLVSSITNHGLFRRLDTPITLYCGIDPTADAPHIGNLLPMTCGLRFLTHGHSVISLIGGATGAIGDPSGRSTERNALDPDQLAHNVAGLTHQVHRFYSNALGYAERRGYSLASTAAAEKVQVVNNADWYANMSLVDFLGDVGRHARVSAMLSRESVRARMESEAGISFTEFAYQLLQAHDFYHLYATKHCQLQIGGSDQWGNIVAGLDMIRKRHPPMGTDQDDPAFGLTLPLVTTASGEKFGKSAGNAVWMDEKKTSVFDFYQFFMRTQDADVEQYLKYFTLMPLKEIDDLIMEHDKSPERRLAQKTLADEVTEMVHSESLLQKARVQTELMYAQSRAALHDLDVTAVLAAFENDPRLARVELAEGMTIAELCAKAGACTSKSEAVKLAKRGGLYLNQERVVDALNQKVTNADLVGGRMCIVRTGKTNYWIVEVAPGAASS